MKPLLFLALIWTIIPAIPTLWNGGILGSPHTDLYFSVWSMHIPWMDQSGGTHSTWINFPEGQSIYSSAYIKSIGAWLLSPLLSPAQSYNFLLLLSRFAGPVAACFAMRAWGYSERAATGFAVFLTMSPFVHGYAVEGIVEGVDVWPLALWLWACQSNKKYYMPLSLALCLLMSWYLGATVCLLTLILSVYKRDILHSLWGVICAAPAIWLFMDAHPTLGEIEPAVRQAMSAQWGIPVPNLLAQPNPFAKNNYLGWCSLVVILAPRYALWALIPLALSFGLGSDWPILSFVRFPYRWHLATLCLLGFAIADVLEKKSWHWFSTAILLEWMFLSGVDLFLPTSNAHVATIYTHIDRPILDIPGPMAIPPGQANPTRKRAEYLLYAQLYHHQPSLWAHDFNGLNTVQNKWEHWKTWDPLYKKEPHIITVEDHVDLIEQDAGVVIHRDILGQHKSELLKKNLEDIGFSLIQETESHFFFRP